MSSPLRRDPPEMIDADREAGRLLAVDADRAREARDWRTATAGGPPAVVAREATPDRWHLHAAFGMTLAREVARAAANDGLTPSAWVRELVIAEITARTGHNPEHLRENLTVTRRNRARVLRT
jgi:hypothetical protein